MTFACRWLKCACRCTQGLSLASFLTSPQQLQWLPRCFTFLICLLFGGHYWMLAAKVWPQNFLDWGGWSQWCEVEINSSFASGGVRGRAWEDFEAFTFLHHSLVALLWYGRLTILFTSALRGFISADWFRSFLQQLSDDGVLLHLLGTELLMRVMHGCFGWNHSGVVSQFYNAREVKM